MVLESWNMDVMSVGELINVLKKYPEDMIVGIDRDPLSDIHFFECTCVHNNHPYNLPDFQYLNIE